MMRLWIIFWRQWGTFLLVFQTKRSPLLQSPVLSEKQTIETQEGEVRSLSPVIKDRTLKKDLFQVG